MTDDRRPTSHFGKFQMCIVQSITLQRVIRSTSCLVLRWGFQVGGSNGSTSGRKKIQDGGRRLFWTISNGHISPTRRLFLNKSWKLKLTESIHMHVWWKWNIYMSLWRTVGVVWRQISSERRETATSDRISEIVTRPVPATVLLVDFAAVDRPRTSTWLGRTDCHGVRSD